MVYVVMAYIVMAVWSTKPTCVCDMRCVAACRHVACVQTCGGVQAWAQPCAQTFVQAHVQNRAETRVQAYCCRVYTHLCTHLCACLCMYRVVDKASNSLSRGVREQAEEPDLLDVPFLQWILRGAQARPQGWAPLRIDSKRGTGNSSRLCPS